MAGNGRRLIVWSLIILFAMILLSLLIGPSGFGLSALRSALQAGDWSAGALRILLYVRIPRMLAAVMTGAALSVSGFVLQQVLLNPMASPGLLGINAGAGLGALMASILLPAAVWVLPVFAFAGALLATLIIYAIAGSLGAARRTIILAGIAISSILGAASDTIVSLVPDAAVYRSLFSIGGFAQVTLSRLVYPGLMMVPAFLAVWALRGQMRLLPLGDDVAGSLGVRTRRSRLTLLAAASLLAASAVSYGGLIGFVGLVVPHLSRYLIGEKTTPLGCALLGASLCLVCDTIARTCFAPYELPVSVLLAAIGAPYLLFLLLKRKEMAHAV